MHGYPQFSFWISIALAKAKICFSKPRKNTLILVGIILNEFFSCGIIFVCQLKIGLKGLIL